MNIRRIARAATSIRGIASCALGTEKVAVGIARALVLEAVVLGDVVGLRGTVLGAAEAGLRSNG